jgi:PAS domain S-box-containing protein
MDPEQIVEQALTALSTHEDWRSSLDAFATPVYTTDAQGAVTYWNRACIEFAGREPQLGRDRWCVTWQLYTTIGDPLKHEDCPMAEAIRQQRPIRDAIAIAERPDGTRRAFRPYPTPLFHADGSLKGAVNVLIDVTDEQADSLHEQADRCRRLADALYSRESNTVLKHMASRFEETAEELGRRRKA